MAMRIYLAGKIAKNDWRGLLVPQLRDWNNSFGLSIEQMEALEEWPVWRNAVLGKYDYCGPYFISCDHGCYHGRNDHGYGLEDDTCESGGSYNRRQVSRLCQGALQRCDLVFAWIESLDCYGTLAELGYAKALGKRILIAGPEAKDDLWFTYEFADGISVGPDLQPDAALEQLLTLRSVRETAGIPTILPRRR
jgi:hypothetical protein